MNAYFIYLDSCIGKVAREFGLQDCSFFSFNAFSMIDDSRTIDENIGILLDRCRIILDLRSQEQRKFKNLSTEIVLNYIRENYYKPISLSIIALILKLV